MIAESEYVSDHLQGQRVLCEATDPLHAVLCAAVHLVFPGQDRHAGTRLVVLVADAHMERLSRLGGLNLAHSHGTG